MPHWPRAYPAAAGARTTAWRKTASSTRATRSNPWTAAVIVGGRWKISQTATVIIYFGEIGLKSGTRLTLSGCIRQEKPFLLIDAQELSAARAGERIAAFVHSHAVNILNFGGPRASLQPTAHAYTQQAAEYALDTLHASDFKDT